MNDFRFWDGETGEVLEGLVGLIKWKECIAHIREVSHYGVHYGISRNTALEIVENLRGNYFVSWNGHTIDFNLYALDKETAVHLRLVYNLPRGRLYEKEDS